MLLVALCAIALGGCATSMERTYRGEYFQNFESSALTPAGGGAPLCVHSAQLAERLGMQSASVRANVTVRGRLSKKGRYCNLGAYERVLTITGIVDISDVRAGNE